MPGISEYQNQKLFLDNALAHRRLAHAYLFDGPDRQKKRQFAEEFAAKIFSAEKNTAQAMASKINPDLIIIDQNKLGIEQMRELIASLALKPYQHQRKVAIIDNFENVTDEAASSILKTLEEASASTIIILLTSNKQQLLGTIVSRCQVLYFGHAANKFEAPELEIISKKSIAEKLLAIKGYADLESAQLSAQLLLWLQAEHYRFINEQPQLYRNVQLLIDALYGLKQNFNKKLILERLFLELL